MLLQSCTPVEAIVFRHCSSSPEPPPSMAVSVFGHFRRSVILPRDWQHVCNAILLRRTGLMRQPDFAFGTVVSLRSSAGRGVRSRLRTGSYIHSTRRNYHRSILGSRFGPDATMRIIAQKMSSKSFSRLHSLSHTGPANETLKQFLRTKQ